MIRACTKLEVSETVSEQVITIAQREDREQDSNRIQFKDTDFETYEEAVI